MCLLLANQGSQQPSKTRARRVARCPRPSGSPGLSLSPLAPTSHPLFDSLFIRGLNRARHCRGTSTGARGHGRPALPCVCPVAATFSCYPAHSERRRHTRGSPVDTLSLCAQACSVTRAWAAVSGAALLTVRSPSSSSSSPPVEQTKADDPWRCSCTFKTDRSLARVSLQLERCTDSLPPPPQSPRPPGLRPASQRRAQRDIPLPHP